jgi:hypothetical protein
MSERRPQQSKLLSAGIWTHTKRKLCAQLTAIRKEAQNIYNSVRGV